MDFLQFGNGRKFEPKVDFVNHMSHWAPWADHFKNDPDYDKEVLANMLGYSLEENARLCRRLTHYTKAHAELLFAFVGLVDRLCLWCSHKPVKFGEKEPLSLKGAWVSIQQLNAWRKENKLNIRSVDVD